MCNPLRPIVLCTARTICHMRLCHHLNYVLHDVLIEACLVQGHINIDNDECSWAWW